jgi:hypothetical protein
MTARTAIVHRTRNRLRLRVPERRHDIGFFVALYDNLREIPGVTEIVINPVTSSVLVSFPDGYCSAIESAVQRSRLLTFSKASETTKSPPAKAERASEKVVPLRQRRELRVNDLRTVLFVLMLAVAAHQAIRGRFFAAFISLLLSGYDLISGVIRDRGGATEP